MNYDQITTVWGIIAHVLAFLSIVNYIICDNVTASLLMNVFRSCLYMSGTLGHNSYTYLPKIILVWKKECSSWILTFYKYFKLACFSNLEYFEGQTIGERWPLKTDEY